MPLLNGDISKGLVTRIRTEPLTFSNNDNDFVTKLVPLLSLASVNKTMMETTLQLTNNTIRPYIFLDWEKSLVPSTLSQSQKRQRTDEGSLTEYSAV